MKEANEIVGPEVIPQPMIPIESINALAIFVDGGLTDLLEMIAEEAWVADPDPRTATGRKEMVSAAYKVKRCKTTIDKAGKELVADWKSKAKVVDSERKRAREYLDSLAVQIRAPVTEYEDAKDLKKDIEGAHEAAIVEDSQRALQAKIDRQQEEIDEKTRDYEKQQETDRVQREADDRARRGFEEARDKERRESDQKVADAEKKLRLEREDTARKETEREDQERIEREQKSADELAEKHRQDDLDHQREVNVGAFRALQEMGLSPAAAKQIVVAVAKQEIPGMRMVY